MHNLSKNAPFCNRNVDMCAHFCYKMMQCGIAVWCVVGFMRWVYTYVIREKWCWYCLSKKSSHEDNISIHLSFTIGYYLPLYGVRWRVRTQQKLYVGITAKLFHFSSYSRRMSRPALPPDGEIHNYTTMDLVKSKRLFMFSLIAAFLWYNRKGG